MHKVQCSKYPKEKCFYHENGNFEKCETCSNNLYQSCLQVTRDHFLKAVYISTANSKPPLGLKPKIVKEFERRQEILDAVSRYVNAEKPIPIEWIEEYNELVGDKK